MASLTYQVNSSSTTTNEHLEKKSSTTTSATNNSNGHNNNNNGSGENVIVKDASAPTPIQHNSYSYEDGIEAGDDAIAEEEQAGGEPSSSQQKLKSINDYHDTNKIGFYQTLSLVLNAGLMIYAQGTFSIYPSHSDYFYACMICYVSSSMHTHIYISLTSSLLSSKVGLSGVVLSSLDPNIAIVSSPTSISNNTAAANNNNNNNGTTTDLCNQQDNTIWKNNGGESTLASHTDYCSRTFNNNGCLANTTCIEQCFQSMHGYSSNCSVCFGSILPCGISIGCTFICLADGTTLECQECLTPCRSKFYECSGLDEKVVVVEKSNNITSENDATAITPKDSASSSSSTQCPIYNPNDTVVDEWYNVYNITYGQSIADAWNGGAKFLAIIIVLFSGIWPYVKNIILVVVWYVPMTIQRQSSILLWLSRLSKYTLVDVFAVIGILVGVQITLNIGSISFVSRAEPRFAIIAFFLATAWEFVQIEIIKIIHERKVVVCSAVVEVVESTTITNNDVQEEGEEASNEEGGGEEDNNKTTSSFFPHLWIPA